MFNCRKDESAYDCLTRRIDKFDAILNNKENIASIVNKAADDNCKLNENQLMTMSQRILFLRKAYLFILESDTSKPISFQDCCKKSIEFYHKMSGFKLINNPRILMNWNQTFRKHEKFPHPNYCIEMGKAYVPLLLETFPEAKMKLKKWINRNVGSISCESVANEMRTKIIPKSF